MKKNKLKSFVGLYSFAMLSDTVVLFEFLDKKNLSFKFLSFFYVEAEDEEEAKRKVFDKVIGGYNDDWFPSVANYVLKHELEYGEKIADTEEKMIAIQKKYPDIHGSKDFIKLTDDEFKLFEKDILSLGKEDLDDIVFNFVYYDIYIQENYLKI